MSKLSTRLLLTIVVTASVMFGTIGSATAQTTKAQSLTPSQSALAVSPAITEQVLSPGVQTRLTIKVTNITRVPLPIKSTVKNLTLLEDLLPAADKNIYDASAWFTVDPADFILQPNQTREVSITIATPAKATPGGHYATVYFQPLVPTEALSPTTSYLNARVGVLAFMVVKGDINETATLKNPAMPRLKQFGPVNISTRLANTGNVHLLPNGTVTVRNFRGRAVATLPLKQSLVLPQTIKDFKVQWGNGTTFGYYTAQAELSYGVEDSLLQSESIGFWIIPWLPILLIGGSIIGFVWLFRKTHHRWKAAWKVLRARDDITKVV